MRLIVFRFCLVYLLLFSITVSAQDTFSDTFSSVSYANNNGTQNWSTNWIESNDNNSPTNGYIRIRNPEFDLRFNYIWSENLRRSADLSGYTSATLSFDWRTQSLEAGEALAIEISSDGSSYTVLTSFTGTQSGTFSQDISAYISSTTTIRFAKSGNDWSNGGDQAFIDNVLISAIAQDNDGDGIGDSVDLDDDNDGMTDEEEYCTTANATFLVSADVGTRSVVVNHTDTGYLRLDFSSMDNSFQLDINGTTVHPSILEFENGALGGGEEYFVFDSDGAFISAPWVANSNGLPRLRLIIDDSGLPALYGTRTSSSTTLEPMRAQASTSFNTITWVPLNNNTFTVINQSGPGPEGFTGDLFASAICDTDGDGVSNELDLDSDNDGIYDIVESGVLNEPGVADANNDGVIDGATGGSGSNGLFNGIEDNDTEYAILSYSVLDSDSDGTYDAFSLDSDGDSCNDVIEAGFTDDNDDGYLGPLPVTVDANGLVTSGSDGYTTPNDNDTNTTYDYREAGTPPTITSQPVGATICPGCTTTMTVTSAGDVFQWQLFNGSSWDNLSDTGIYSGTATGTLTITNPTPSENNNQYRVIVSNLGYVCGTTNSNTAILTIQVNTVITNRRITYRVDKN
ncbi:MAG: immunoglobulin domain-containing protein [Allomuricauda sp.]